MKMQRKLKVYYLKTSDNPKIQLSGQWLRQQGFSVGDKICVQCEIGNIKIKRMKQERHS